MTKHRTITGFVAVALLAVAATAGIMRSDSWTEGASLKGLTVDANKIPAADFDDRWSAMSALPATTATGERRLDVH